MITLCALLIPCGNILAQDETVAAILQERLQGVLSNAQTSLSAGACQLSALPVMAKLYERRGFSPIWTSAEMVDQLVAAIQETYREGLDPQDYYLSEIRDLRSQSLIGQSPDPNQVADLDLILTEAFIRLANHTSCGKEDPLTFHPQWNLAKPIGGKDPVTYIEQGLLSQSITQAVDAWRMHHPYYELLKRALARYRSMREAGGWESLPESTVLRLGMSGARVKALRRRLAVEDGQSDPAVSNKRFDDGLQAAVRRFQALHSLTPDGVVGRSTLAELNVPVEDRIDQIRINLERGRWVLKDLEDTFVLVDIAGFRVYFVKAGKPVWVRRAQVGRPFRDTPVFKSRIGYLEINPTWTVPPTIFEQDILPEVQNDRRYLEKKNLQVIDAHGQLIDPKTVDWSLYPQKTFPYQLRQTPGPDNPLGRIKIMFPNQYMVYLHDTPHTELFEQEERMFSSGCIRVEKPFELAELLLDDHQEWNQDTLRKAVATNKTQRITLPWPIAIVLMYATVMVDKEGNVTFQKDPYQRDPAMLQGLGRDADIQAVTAP